MKPPPAKWKGRCDFNKTVCNNKLIGARSYFESAKWKWKGLRDPVVPIEEGQHGTHTASTAAGAFVPDVSVFGNGLGTAAGMAPRRAHRILPGVLRGLGGATVDDILAAVDDAIEDGRRHPLSVSLGHEEAIDFSDDPVSLGGYTAIMNGVLHLRRRGQRQHGPSPGHSSTRRRGCSPWGPAPPTGGFLATVKLGSGIELDGESLNDPKTNMSEPLPLVRDIGIGGTCASESVLLAQKHHGEDRRLRRPAGQLVHFRRRSQASSNARGVIGWP
ncbi:hypothetical protein PR202_ga19415 [Eleusine coracana subsp. coracana]|uniref:Uncharacterized protein n=1 Tax=Eleusine coracana subsp. coracana TaxID=191504 RepID=A0AAV5CWD5_ELECO|nr:hypothetical protein PR202_ga19415 [Eleusine coracana subsp. coracana]